MHAWMTHEMNEDRVLVEPFRTDRELAAERPVRAFPTIVNVAGIAKFATTSEMSERPFGEKIP